MINGSIDEVVSSLNPKVFAAIVGWLAMMVVVGFLLAWKWIRRKNSQQHSKAPPASFETDSAAMLHRYQNLPAPIRARQRKAIRNAGISGVVMTIVVVMGLLVRGCLERPVSRTASHNQH